MWSELRDEDGFQFAWMERPNIYDMNGRKIATVDNEGKIHSLSDGKHIGYLGPPVVA
jgi:hypothetical protein